MIEDFDRIDELLLTALDLSPAERAAFLDVACASKPALRRELELLLAAADKDGVLDTPAIELLDVATQRPKSQTMAPRIFRGNARFRVRRAIGSGGFGAVYECDDLQRGGRVALKVLWRDDTLDRFKREFRTLVNVRHPNVVELYELFCEDGLWFFTMEFVDGVDFLEYVRHQSGVSSSELNTCNIERLRHSLRQLSLGLEALHRNGILHRDIKPANLIVTPDDRLYILDFGLVRDADGDSDQAWSVVGTIEYMSPEQLAGLPLDESADWYSVGVMLFQAITGTRPPRPLEGNAFEHGVPIPRLSGVPPHLDMLCRDLLRETPASRPTGTDILRRLGEVPALAQPQFVRRSNPLALVGRDSHLQTLRDSFASTRRGELTVVNVFGQSGVGKSALLNTFRDEVRESREAVVVVGRCHENENVPFKALDDLVDGLNRYVATLPSAEAEAITPSNVPALVRVFPVFSQTKAFTKAGRPAVEILDPEELRERAFASLTDLLCRLADRRSVILAIDDLQWGDLDSAAFLGRLVTSSLPPTLMLIASYRADEVDISPFLRAWRTHLKGVSSVQVCDLEVGELSEADSLLLTRRLLGQRGEAQDLQFASIVREAAGNPFLIDQLAQYAQAHPDSADVTGTVRELIEDRVGRLAESTQRLLAILAVAGHPVPQPVARAAAGLSTDEQSALLTLVSERLVRIRDTRSAREIAVYHDRIREAMTAAMPIDAQRRLHKALAVAFESYEGGDPGVLATHFYEAGETERCAVYARTAAEQAAQALAFDRAVFFFRLTLETGSFTTQQTIAIRKQIANALTQAGQGLQAAEAFFETARIANRDERLELQRLAGEQLLRSGHIAKGLATLGEVARQLHVWPAEKPWQAILSLAFHVVRLMLRGGGPNHVSGTPDALATPILETYWSLATGLALVDLIRSADFSARHLLLALQSGDRRQIALSLAADATQTAALRGVFAPKTRKLLASARELADGSDQTQAKGFVAVMEGVAAFYAMDWKSASALAERAERVLREECTGVAWERGVNRIVTLTAAVWLGKWRNASEHFGDLARLLEEAKAVGDDFAIFTNLLTIHISCLSSDQPGLVKEFCRDIVAHVPADRFYYPHFTALFAEAETLVYQGDAEGASELLESQWPALSASFMNRVKYNLIGSSHLRARVALSVASHTAGSKHVRLAGKIARQLEHTTLPWARAAAALTNAGIASLSGAHERASVLLGVAEHAYADLHMSHYVAASCYRRGQLLGGEAGLSLKSQADAWARRERVLNPSRIFDVLAPGNWTRT